MIEKAYIGDGVYAEVDAYDRLILTTENGISVTNIIVLEWQVWRGLGIFCRQWEDRH